MTPKPDTPATPVAEMTTEEAAAFILSMPKERLTAARDGLRAQLFAEKEEGEEAMKNYLMLLAILSPIVVWGIWYTHVPSKNYTEYELWGEICLKKDPGVLRERCERVFPYLKREAKEKK